MLRRNIGWRKLSRWIWTLSGIAVFIGIWTAASFEIGNAVLLPAPTAVVSGFVSLLRDGTLMADVVASLKRVLGGFAIASATAIPLALIMAFSRPVELLLSPIITFLRPIPPIAWIPIAILWFGIGDPPSYFITAIAAFFTAIEALSVGSMGTLAHVLLSYYSGYSTTTPPWRGPGFKYPPKYRSAAQLMTVECYSTKAVIGSQRRRRTSTTP